MEVEFEVAYMNDDPSDLVRWENRHGIPFRVRVWDKANGEFVGKVDMSIQQVDGKPTITVEVQNENEVTK